MADPPEQLTLERHRDLAGREKRPVARWILLGVLGLFCVLGLGNAFGQHPLTDTAESDAARLELSSPPRLRTGLYFESRFSIHARRELEEATLVLAPGWLEGMTVNTVEPGPVGEASRDGRIALELGHIAAGSEYVLYLQSQVNPTAAGRRSQDVELYDGEQLLLTLDRTVTVFP